MLHTTWAALYVHMSMPMYPTDPYREVGDVDKASAKRLIAASASLSMAHNRAYLIQSTPEVSGIWVSEKDSHNQHAEGELMLQCKM